MTIADGGNRIQYTGNGATSVYSTGTIVFYAATDLIVTERVIATGVETTYVKDTDYTVSGGSGAAGSITLLAGNLPSTKQITIERSIPYEQQSDYIEAQEILAEEIETSFDKLTVMTQQIKDQAERSLKFSTTLPSSLVPILTDAPVDGQLLAWSGASGNVENATLSSMSSVLDTVFSGLASGDFLQYNGTNWVNKTTAEIKTSLGLVQNNYAATTAPGVGDDSVDGYSIGSQWYDGTNDNMYHCLDASVGAAVWVQGDIVAADLGSAALAALIDDDTFATATAANIPSAESTKTYVDNQISALREPVLQAVIDGSGTPSVTYQRGDVSISSITDNATGDFTLNFSQNFASANYYVALTAAAYGASGNQGIVASLHHTSPRAVGSVRINTRTLSGSPALYDAPEIHITIWGTLA